MGCAILYYINPYLNGQEILGFNSDFGISAFDAHIASVASQLSRTNSPLTIPPGEKRIMPKESW